MVTSTKPLVFASSFSTLSDMLQASGGAYVIEQWSHESRMLTNALEENPHIT